MCRAALAIMAALLLAGCSGSRRPVPNTEFMNFPAALRVLRTDGFKVAVPYFPPFGHEPAEQGRGRLENYTVIEQRPAAATQAQKGSEVTLALTLPQFEGPIGSLATPARHPASILVPNLVGLTYPRALDTGLDAGWKGYWVRLEWVAPLDPQASTNGLQAFRVVAQQPSAGTRISFGGIRTGRPGVNPPLSTITVTLGQPGQDKGEALRAIDQANARAWLALNSAERVNTSQFEQLFSPVATCARCRIPRGPVGERGVSGRCATAST